MKINTNVKAGDESFKISSYLEVVVFPSDSGRLDDLWGTSGEGSNGSGSE